MNTNESRVSVVLTRRDVDRVLGLIDSLGSAIHEIMEVRSVHGRNDRCDIAEYESRFYRLHSRTMLELDGVPEYDIVNYEQP